MKKALSYAFFGKLSKHHAGARPLTDWERRMLLLGFYSLAAQVIAWQWRAAQLEAAIHEDAMERLEENRDQNIALMRERALERANFLTSVSHIRDADQIGGVDIDDNN